MNDQSKAQEIRSKSHEKMVERLRSVREYLGLSQEFVAAETGIPRPAISAIENGKRKVEALELTALAALYKYPVTYFLDGAFEAPDSIVALAREATGLTDRDREQVLQFAKFLKAYSKGLRHNSALGGEASEGK